MSDRGVVEKIFSGKIIFIMNRIKCKARSYYSCKHGPAIVEIEGLLETLK